MIKFITPIFFIALCMLSSSSCKQETKQESTLTFEFMSLGEPEVRNTLDTNQMGEKFYLRTNQGSDSILIKINVINDDWLFEENDSIYNSKIKPDYFYAVKDKTLDSFIKVIKNRYVETPNGSLKENTFFEPAIYNGGTHFFRIKENNVAEKYYCYQLTNLQEPLKSFHYYIKEKYYYKQFIGKKANVFINTDSLALAYFMKPGIFQVYVPPPRIDKIMFVPPIE